MLGMELESPMFVAYNAESGIVLPGDGQTSFTTRSVATATTAGSRLGDQEMTDELRGLIEAAKRIPSSAEEREEQRRSFAYGNTAFENERITRAMIDEQAEKLSRQAAEDGRR